MISASRGAARDSLLYLNHIPKTAGTSFRNTVERVFHPASHNTYWFVDDYLREPHSKLNSYALLSGHFLMLPVMMNDRAHRMMTFLREPVARAFSHFMHIKNDPLSGWRHIVRDMSFEDFIFSPAAEAELLSFQTRHLGILSPQVYFEVKDRLFDRSLLVRHFRSKAVIENAKRTLDQSWFVGLTERYAESIRRLSARFGVPLDPEARLNAARVPYEVTAISPAARRRLDWLNEFDLEIYEYACNRFDRETDSPPKFSLDREFFKSHIDFQAGFVGGGWHPVESREGKGYCWSSTASPWLAFLAPWAGGSFLSARVATWISTDLTDIRVLVNGVEISIDFALAPGQDGANFMYMSGAVPAGLCDPDGMLKIEFRLPRIVRPCELSSDQDDRDLGVYANWVRLVPATGSFNQ
jgi:hypothetical protein